MKQAHSPCPYCQCYVAEDGEQLTVLVNGQPVAGRIALRAGDTITYVATKSGASTPQPPAENPA